MKKDFLLDSKSESFYHKSMKQLIFKYILKNDKNIQESSLEKNIYHNKQKKTHFFRDVMNFALNMVPLFL